MLAAALCGRVSLDGLRSRILAPCARGLIELRSLAGGRDHRRFVIIGIARTGSTMLRDLLNSHGEALAFGELFRSADRIGWDLSPFDDRQPTRTMALFRSDPVRFIETEVYRRWPSRLRAVGFKIFYYHAQTPPHDAVWRYLDRQADVAVIHVVRSNVLRQYLSLRLAHCTGSWSTTSPAREQEPIHIDVEDCLRHFAYVRSSEQASRERFASHPFIEVRYEDLVRDQGAEMARIQRFLGLSPRPGRTSLKRQQGRPLSEAIDNYNELEEACAGTPWARFFDD